MKFANIFYGVLSVILITLTALKIIPVVWGLSFIWFPLGYILVTLMGISFSHYLTTKAKEKEEKFIPTCKNCIWKRVQKELKKEQCEGEEKGNKVEHDYCESYIRDHRKL